MLFINKKCSNCQGYYDSTLNECPHCHKDNELYQRRSVLNNVFFFHPYAQIGLFVCGFAYVGMLMTEILGNVFFGDVVDKLLSSAIILAFTYLMMFGGLMSIVLTTRRKEFFKRFTRPLDYAFGAAYAIGIIVAGIIVSIIVSQFYKGDENTNQAAAILISHNYPIIACLVLCFLGPICEELTYRVGLYSLLRRINVFLAMGVTVLVFTFIHFDFSAENMVGELWSIPSYLISAAILTIAYEHRGPACAITAHMAYNTFAFIMIMLPE